MLGVRIREDLDWRDELRSRGSVVLVRVLGDRKAAATRLFAVARGGGKEDEEVVATAFPLRAPGAAVVDDQATKDAILAELRRAGMVVHDRTDAVVEAGGELDEDLAHLLPRSAASSPPCEACYFPEQGAASDSMVA